MKMYTLNAEKIVIVNDFPKTCPDCNRDLEQCMFEVEPFHVRFEGRLCPKCQKQFIPNKQYQYIKPFIEDGNDKKKNDTEVTHTTQPVQVTKTQEKHDTPTGKSKAAIYKEELLELIETSVDQKIDRDRLLNYVSKLHYKFDRSIILAVLFSRKDYSMWYLLTDRLTLEFPDSKYVQIISTRNSSKTAEIIKGYTGNRIFFNSARVVARVVFNNNMVEQLVTTILGSEAAKQTTAKETGNTHQQKSVKEQGIKNDEDRKPKRSLQERILENRTIMQQTGLLSALRSANSPANVQLDGLVLEEPRILKEIAGGIYLTYRLRWLFLLSNTEELHSPISKQDYSIIDYRNNTYNDYANRILSNKEKGTFILKKDQLKPVEKEQEQSQTDQEVYVYHQLTNRCERNGHIIETVTAETENIRTGLKIKVNVFHCKTCGRYFINHEALQNYIKRGIYPSFRYHMEDVPYGQLKEKSQLMLYGYNVRAGELTETERHRILSWIIDSGLMRKDQIIRDLQFKVAYNGSKAGNENAREKWQTDIKYVSQYVKGNTQTIKAVFKRER